MDDSTNTKGAGTSPSTALLTTMSPQQELVRSWRTIAEMIRDRGQDASGLESMSADDLVHAANGRQVFYIDDTVSGYRIIYDMSSKFKSANVKKMIDSSGGGGDEDGASTDGASDSGEPKIRAYIVVVRKWGTSTSMNAVSRDVQYFELRRLLCNLSRHFLVPKHEPVRDEEEIGKLLERYMIKSRFQLPIIYDKDPMAQYLALKHGQLVRITRNSPTAGLHTMYRCCCTKAE